jgi:integrase
MLNRKELLSRRAVDGLPPPDRRLVVWDTKVDGFGLRVSPNGSRTYVFVYRYPRGRSGKVKWYKIGTTEDFSPEAARAEAEILRGDYQRGNDPMARLQDQRDKELARLAAPKTTVEQIAKDFIARHAKKRNRSWKETQRILNRHVISAWGPRQIESITRAEVNSLLDDIEDNSGSPMATAVLAQVRKMFNWHATRDGNFNSPIVRGMARTSPKQMARTRVLSDGEIQVLWQALDDSPAPYRQLVRFLLLTAQRREEAAQALQADFSGDKWTIPASRYKTGIPHVVPLTDASQAQIKDLGDLLKLGKYAFTTTGDKPFSGYSKAKHQLDERMEELLREKFGEPEDPKKKHLVPWRIHDLRRTAKTLMVRAGARPDITERVLGHVIPGVEGVYDRHSYWEEKKAALTSLANELANITSRQKRSPQKCISNKSEE